jgi:hypothetical protein
MTNLKNAKKLNTGFFQAILKISQAKIIKFQNYKISIKKISTKNPVGKNSI